MGAGNFLGPKWTLPASNRGKGGGGWFILPWHRATVSGVESKWALETKLQPC